MKNSRLGKKRVCRLDECSIIIESNNGKKAFCCPEHRLKYNALRREERDHFLNLWIKRFKRNYQVLLMHTVGTILSREELLSVGFHFQCLPNIDDAYVHWFGNLGLATIKVNNDLKYQILKK